ncbi:MAG: hypothetical protein IIA62_04080 [Nitrospinae bacterium]|nr:hypothetical protein [Nitrospinota bacterium]
MVRIALTSILFLLFAGSAQAIPVDFHADSGSMQLNPNLDGETLLIAKGPPKDKGPKNKGPKNKDPKGKKWKGKGPPGIGNAKHIFANSALPAWAHDCGLPPGLAKQNKIPPGWEKKCRGGIKYYDHEHEFRQELMNFYGISAGVSVTAGSPAYQTLHAMDESHCQVKSVTSAGGVLEGAAVGAVYGGLIGAAGGAVIGSATGRDVGDSAMSGAGTGALTGAVIGGIIGSQEYKSSYKNCMRHRGH